MKKRNDLFGIIGLVLALVLLCTAAGCRGEKLPDYRESAFFAEIRYESEGVPICAEVTVGECPSDAAVLRDVEVVFTAPPSISGLCVTRSNGSISVKRGSAEIPSGTATSGFLRAAELLMAEGALEELGKTEENGLEFYRARITGTDGDIELLVDGAGIPKRVESGTLTVTVVRFEARGDTEDAGGRVQELS